MERMVANRTRNYGGTNPWQFGNRSCRWGGLFEWTGCIQVIVWGLYVWLALWQTSWGTCYCFQKFSPMQATIVAMNSRNEHVVTTTKKPKSIRGAKFTIVSCTLFLPTKFVEVPIVVVST